MANTYSLDLELSSSQYALIIDASQTGLDITGDMTIEAWIMLEQLPSTAGSNFVICSKDDVGVSRAYSFLVQSADNKLLLATFGTASTSTRFTMDEVFDADDLGVWIHVTASIDVSASTIAFHKNTVSKAGTSVIASATDIINSSAPFMVGSRYTSSSAGEYFDGKIDELRVWNDIRSGAEIAANWITDIDPASAGLVGYWKFENNYLDETSNNNDLTATNSPVFSTSVPFTTFTRSLVDSMSLTDTITRITTFNRSLINSIGITDQNTYDTILLAMLVDSIGVTDDMDSVMAYIRALVDSEDLTDVVSYPRFAATSLYDKPVTLENILREMPSLSSVEQIKLKLSSVLDDKITLEFIDDK